MRLALGATARGCAPGTRSGPNVSLVTSPAHTRSHSAVSSTASSAVPAAATRSGQNDAPARSKLVADRVVQSGPSAARADHRRREQLDPVAEEQADAAVVGAERARADPHQLARRAQLVEHRRAVAVDPRREHVALEHRRRDRDALQLFDRFDQRVGAAPAPTDALPGGEEPDERRRVDGLDLVAQRGERAPAQRAQHAGVAPLALDAAGPELAVHDAARGSRRANASPRAFGR